MRRWRQRGRIINTIGTHGSISEGTSGKTTGIFDHKAPVPLGIAVEDEHIASSGFIWPSNYLGLPYYSI
jgi:hypothetical protein